MYRDKTFRERNLAQVLLDVDEAGRLYPAVTKVFVADGDALVMDTDRWIPILHRIRAAFPGLRRVSCYATAQNVIEKGEEELQSAT
jgi:hypothetical protein